MSSKVYLKALVPPSNRRRVRRQKFITSLVDETNTEAEAISLQNKFDLLVRWWPYVSPASYLK